MYTGFTRHPLDERYSVFIGRLDPALLPDSPGFEALWSLQRLQPRRAPRLEVVGLSGGSGIGFVESSQTR